MNRKHKYSLKLSWTGNRGDGTVAYGSYNRSFDLDGSDKPTITGSADPAFRGDRTCWNPEELLVASVSACHQLWYLHLCADSGVIVVAYHDEPSGVMQEEQGGSGQFEQVTLRPTVTISSGSDSTCAERLHHEAHQQCFIARSVRFPVYCEPTILVEAPR